MSRFANVVDNHQEEVAEILNEAASHILKTMGSRGGNTLIQHVNHRHVASKDGLTVLKHIIPKQDDLLGDLVLDLLKDVSSSLVSNVGDGSSSAVLLSAEIATALNNCRNLDYSARDLLEAYAGVTSTLISQLKMLSTTIDPSTEEGTKLLNKLASVSTNGDPISKMIVEAYEKVGILGSVRARTALMDGAPDSIVYENGYTHPQGAADTVFFNNSAVSSDYGNCTLENTDVLVTDMGLTGGNLQWMIGLLTDKFSDAVGGGASRGLLIIAPSYDDAFMKMLNGMVLENRNMGNELPLLLVCASVKTAKLRSRLEDTAAYLNTTILEQDQLLQKYDNLYSRFGRAANVTSTMTTTTFTSDSNLENANLDARLKLLKEKLVETESDIGEEGYESKLKELETRLAHLNAKRAVITVGGGSRFEKNSRHDLVDDAVRACSSAIEHGVNPASNLMVPYIANHILNGLIKVNMTSLETILLENVIYPAYLNAYVRLGKVNGSLANIKRMNSDLVENKLIPENKIMNFNTWQAEPMLSTEIINSTETDIMILRSVDSIITRLMLSNQILLLPTHKLRANEEPEEDQPEALLG